MYYNSIIDGFKSVRYVLNNAPSVTVMRERKGNCLQIQMNNTKGRKLST